MGEESPADASPQHEPEHQRADEVRGTVPEAERRDTKGLYAKAIAGEIKEFTGISDPYEEPAAPELTINTEGESPEESAARVVDYLEQRGLVQAAVAA